MLTYLKLSATLSLRKNWNNIAMILIAPFLLVAVTFVGDHSFHFLFLVNTFWFVFALDLNFSRFSHPIDISNLLTFPQSFKHKFRKLLLTELAGIKLPAFLMYMAATTYFNELYKFPLLLINMLMLYIIATALIMPLMHMVKRSKTYVSLANAIGMGIALVFITIINLRFSGPFYKALDNYYQQYEWLVSVVLLFLLMIAFQVSAFCFRKIQYNHPFINEAVFEKFQKQKGIFRKQG